LGRGQVLVELLDIAVELDVHKTERNGSRNRDIKIIAQLCLA
jgi:hypothetical protein